MDTTALTPAQRQDAACWLAANCLGYDANQMVARLQAARAAMDARYPVSDAPELPARMAADTATYQRALLERTARRQREIEQHLMAE